MSFEAKNSVPLCVDLDGTLVRTDMLFESFLILLRSQPMCLFLVPFWLFKGKAYLKEAIASRVNLDTAELLLNNDVVEFVKTERQHRQTVLVTGSHQSIADHVAKKTDLFDEVVGSDGQTNLTNNNKRQWLIERFGEKGFDYIGNDSDDLKVWPSANKALVVSEAGGIASHTSISFSKVFDVQKSNFRDFLSLLRVHQWLKNILLVVPFVLDHRFGDWSATMHLVLAYFAMSLLASMTYIFNDMLDLQLDRRNPTKSKRALPRGAISLPTAVKVMVVLAVCVLILALFLPAAFNLILLSYLVLTLLYSFVLKRVAILDVSMIAALHTLRVIGGTVAIQAVWSFWLLAFSMFFFFSLALAKRVAELMNLKDAGKLHTGGRDYSVADIPVLLASGVSTGFMSVLIVALYINSEKVLTMYDNPEFLWLVCPILMYWVGRLWIIAARGLLHEDPIVWAIRDKVSFVTIGLVAWVIAFAMVL